MRSRRSFLTRAVAALAVAPVALGTRVPEAQASPLPDHLRQRITDVIDHPERYPDAMALARQYSGADYSAYAGIANGTLTIQSGSIDLDGTPHGDRMPTVAWRTEA